MKGMGSSEGGNDNGKGREGGRGRGRAMFNSLSRQGRKVPCAEPKFGQPNRILPDWANLEPIGLTDKRFLDFLSSYAVGISECGGRDFRILQAYLGKYPAHVVTSPTMLSSFCPTPDLALCRRVGNTAGRPLESLTHRTALDRFVSRPSMPRRLSGIHGKKDETRQVPDSWLSTAQHPWDTGSGSLR
jgi:hypothetical protein